MANGKVTLVGAGPSSIDLLTIKGFNAIQDAQVVVFDKLVSQDIINIVPKNVEMIDVGKQNNHHPVPQDEINQILVDKAKEGKNVVRLKGGDCFLFGRGGEECEFLLDNKIEFEVISGVTSAIAAPAYAGIPITHRDFSSSVHIITAHAKKGSEVKIDFDALVRLNGTLVFLMGLSSIEKVINGLINANIDIDMPAAVIENGTLPKQRKVVGTVQNIVKLTKDNNFQSPSIIVIGKVCSLSNSLDWFSKQPLFNKTVIVTRQKDKIGTISGKLKKLGANVIEFPCINITEQVDSKKFKEALNEKKYDCVVLTSPNGVNAMVNSLYKIGKDLRALHSCLFAVVGKSTALELQKYGITADLIPDEYDSLKLGKLLCEKLEKNSNVLILRAQKGSQEILDELQKNNINFTQISTYKTEFSCNNSDNIKKLLSENSIDIVTFTSVSTVEGFTNSLKLENYNNFTAICIGKQTANAALKYGMNVKISKEATINSMIDLILEEK